MARALVIKNADFSVNKLTTVVFNDVPCTGVSLNKNTASITSIGGTTTITATLSPVDTTDAVIWSSSNTAVATVEGGVVTATGCGSATITATCGNYSASCAVTVTHVATLSYAINRYFSKASNKNYLQGGNLDNYAIGFQPTGTYKISYDDRNEDRYPIIIPSGANQIVITCTNFKPYGFWLNSAERAASGVNVATAFTKDDFGNTPSDFGDRTVDIPAKTGDYASMDSVGFVFKYNGTLESDSALSEITVTFVNTPSE